MITEEMLKNAAEASCKAQEQQLTAGFDPAQVHAFSPDFEEKMQQLRRKSRQARIYRLIRQTAAVLAVVLALFKSGLFTTMRSEAAYIGWSAHREEPLYIYEYGGKAEGEDANYEIVWLPEGYQEVSYEERAIDEYYYMDERGNELSFGYAVNPNHSKLYFLVDASERLDSLVHDYRADLFLSQEENTASTLVWWDENDTLFYVTGFFEEETLVKIAESVVKIEK